MRFAAQRRNQVEGAVIDPARRLAARDEERLAHEEQGLASGMISSPRQVSPRRYPRARATAIAHEIGREFVSRSSLGA
ncbi:MAG: hypothetical protein IPK33_25765 [Gemmatimonadetes bacterium]|nr:hypothetical protein [Gemmatimonadota bacterium]